MEATRENSALLNIKYKKCSTKKVIFATYAQIVYFNKGMDAPVNLIFVRIAMKDEYKLI